MKIKKVQYKEVRKCVNGHVYDDYNNKDDKFHSGYLVSCPHCGDWTWLFGLYCQWCGVQLDLDIPIEVVDWDYDTYSYDGDDYWFYAEVYYNNPPKYVRIIGSPSCGAHIDALARHVEGGHYEIV